MFTQLAFKGNQSPHPMREYHISHLNSKRTKIELKIKSSFSEKKRDHTLQIPLLMFTSFRLHHFPPASSSQNAINTLPPEAHHTANLCFSPPHSVSQQPLMKTPATTKLPQQNTFYHCILNPLLHPPYAFWFTRPPPSLTNFCYAPPSIYHNNHKIIIPSKLSSPPMYTLLSTTMKLTSFVTQPPPHTTEPPKKSNLSLLAALLCRQHHSKIHHQLLPTITATIQIIITHHVHIHPFSEQHPCSFNEFLR